MQDCSLQFWREMVRTPEPEAGEPESNRGDPPSLGPCMHFPGPGRHGGFCHWDVCLHGGEAGARPACFRQAQFKSRSVRKLYWHFWHFLTSVIKKTINRLYLKTLLTL